MQVHWKLNVWYGIFGNHLIGHVFLDGARFLNILQTQLMDGELLDHVPVALATHY